MQASKWLKNPMLLSPEEMADLIQHLSPAKLYITGRVVQPGHGLVEPAQFLEVYCTYVNQLRAGIKPKPQELQPYFSCSITCDSDSIEELNPAADKQLLRVKRPVIQMQHHTMDYSVADKKFHSMILGTHTIDWGVQFSYPQLFQDPSDQQIMQVDATENFPNTRLFRNLQRWMREHTIPTPFIVQGVVVHAPIRIGKECLDWVQSHPDLNFKGFSVDNSRNHSNRE
jgi:hypothetical protein